MPVRYNFGQDDGGESLEGHHHVGNINPAPLPDGRGTRIAAMEDTMNLGSYFCAPIFVNFINAANVMAATFSEALIKTSH